MCFPLNSIDTIVLGDEKVEFLIWVFDRADLVFVVDEVSIYVTRDLEDLWWGEL